MVDGVRLGVVLPPTDLGGLFGLLFSTNSSNCKIFSSAFCSADCLDFTSTSSSVILFSSSLILTFASPSSRTTSSVSTPSKAWLEGSSVCSRYDVIAGNCVSAVSCSILTLRAFLSIQIALTSLSISSTGSSLASCPSLSNNKVPVDLSSFGGSISSFSIATSSCISFLTAEISGKLREAGAEDPDEEANELKRFRTETNDWSETARKLIHELVAIENEEIEPPKLERSTGTLLLEREGHEASEEPVEEIESDVSAICIDKNARSVSIEQLTADTQLPAITSYLEQTELPSSHALEGVDTEEVVRELGEAKVKISELEKRITELEVEVKSKQSAEQNALEKILQLEELVEKSKPKSPPKSVGGKTTPKRTPSTTGRTSVTPSRPTK